MARVGARGKVWRGRYKKRVGSVGCLLRQLDRVLANVGVIEELIVPGLEDTAILCLVRD